MLRDSPLHCFSSSRPRAGKSFQADLCALIATGRTAPAMSATDDPAEEEKRIVSILLSGVPLALIDNIDEPLRSARLCSAITQETFRGRLLGYNRTADLPTRLVWFASGNNLRLHDDLNPRALLGYLVPDTDRPEEREFDRDLKPWVIERRHRLAPAAITVLRAYIAAGSPGQGLKGFGAAPDWSALVRSALVWLGQDDPATTQERLRQNDPVASALARLLAAWFAAYGKTKMTAAEVVKNAYQHPDLEDVLKDVASKDGDKVNTRVLGNYLVAHANRIEGGFQLLVGGTRSNYALYQVLKHSDRHGQNSRNSHNSPNEHDSGEFGEFGEFSDPRSKTCAACKNYTPAPDNDGGTCAYHESAVEYPAAHTCSQWETAS
jgi:putative DNA primase/helicase